MSLRPQVLDPRPIDFHYLGVRDSPPGRIAFADAWEIQQQIHAQVATGELGTQVLFVEHDPVYTAGSRTLPEELPQDGTEVVQVNRGGKITWHGPGQLVSYPIMFIPNGIGVVDFVRRLEVALIATLAKFEINSIQVSGRTGVWLPATANLPLRKIAAIGVRVTRQTTLHGFALNVSNSLTRFDNIIPCGILDAPVTSMVAELNGLAPSLAEIAEQLEPHLASQLRFS